MFCYNYIFLKLYYFLADGACTVIRVGSDVDSFGDSERMPNPKVGLHYVILCLCIIEIKYKIDF